ncbi:protein MKS1-like [Lolium rigidum]|uniref:protein MKS1-like n=1 Tax=Lolium rigidum TaxID=89674 RepID=UPI001F5E26FE|nr:protein MKS1-like [Lolium rigidum]
MEHSASAPTTTSSSSPQRGGGRELQLQGPRPTPLRVHKDSHRIRKPTAQVRQPVIIYTVSPKVVHAHPAEFMSVVQRLTGASSSSSLPPPPPQQQPPFSPAARLAAIEQASAQPAARTGVHRGGLPPLPSILSPVPGSLPAIPPGFFSPPSGSAGGINLFGELISPAFPGDHGAFAGAAPPPMSSSLQYFPAAAAPSPSTPYYWDLFNNHPNHL